MDEAAMGRLRPGGQAVVVTRTPLGGVRMNGSAPLLNTRGRGRIGQAHLYGYLESVVVSERAVISRSTTLAACRSGVEKPSVNWL
ncbi:hypothetical protein AB7M16_002925 [Bradyrhizobium sp. USDA 372]